MQRTQFITPVNVNSKNKRKLENGDNSSHSSHFSNNLQKLSPCFISAVFIVSVHH